MPCMDVAFLRAQHHIIKIHLCITASGNLDVSGPTGFKQREDFGAPME